MDAAWPYLVRLFGGQFRDEAVSDHLEQVSSNLFVDVSAVGFHGPGSHGDAEPNPVALAQRRLHGLGGSVLDAGTHASWMARTVTCIALAISAISWSKVLSR